MTEGALVDDLEIRPEVANRLGYYVYLYIDPRDGRPFYVGKGKDDRALSHLSEEAESRKCATIAALRAAGLEPRIDILAHALRDEETAFRIESAVIDLFGLDALTNEARVAQSSVGADSAIRTDDVLRRQASDRDRPGDADPDQSSLSAQHERARVV